jgi:hypothetical protein
MDSGGDFHWKCEPEAEALIKDHLKRACQGNRSLADLAGRLIKETSSSLFDWLDHISLKHSKEIENQLVKTGFTPLAEHSSKYTTYEHQRAQLPRVVLYQSLPSEIEVAVSVESIADFLMMREGISHTQIEGSPYSGYRRALVSRENKVSFFVVERRGSMTMEPITEDKQFIHNYFAAKEKWQMRERDGQDEEASIKGAIQLAKEIAHLIGQDAAACLVLECERHYWQAKNHAGHVQKGRQDRVGMGWANHDHHTFRSSRKFFHYLVQLFEVLGFHCRERFYAGDEAGWGAQVMENPRAHLVLFLDVDLAPHELPIDFAHKPMSDLHRLGTIGLWCRLHGDSILKSGMHHLEAQFMFDELKQDLAGQGVEMMEPFSNFSYLKQAFTKGEMWKVDPVRLESLFKEKIISKEQMEHFAKHGALGSHLENLQRKEGYKGFNQKNVSHIIKETDPRLNA